MHFMKLVVQKVLSQCIALLRFYFYYHRHFTRRTVLRRHSENRASPSPDQISLKCSKTKRIKRSHSKRSQKKRPKQQLANNEPPNLGMQAFLGNWSALTEQAPLYPQHLSCFFRETETRRRYPIHIACSNLSLPVYCLRALIEADPSGDTLQAQDIEGSTPLHVLLNVASPQYELIQLLVEACPAVVTIQDAAGRRPLFHAIDNDVSLDIIKLLVERTNGVDAITHRCGLLPSSNVGRKVDLFRARRYARYSNMRESHRTPLYIAWDNIFTNRGMRELHAGNIFAHTKGKRLDKAILLLKAAYTKKCREEGHPSTTFRLLHAALTMHEYLPIPAIEYAITSHSHQISQCEEGSKRYPHHILASISMSNRTVQQQLMYKVLDIYPQAVTECDWKGQLPFHCCLKSGKFNTSPITIALYDKFPEAASRQDESTGLYPFALPAFVAAKNPLSIPPSHDGDDEVLELTMSMNGINAPLGTRRTSFFRDVKCLDKKGQHAENRGSSENPSQAVRRPPIQCLSQLMDFETSQLEDEIPNEYEMETTIFELLLHAPECVRFILNDLQQG